MGRLIGKTVPKPTERNMGSYPPRQYPNRNGVQILKSLKYCSSCEVHSFLSLGHNEVP